MDSMLKQYGLTDEDCNSVITDVHLDLISRSCCEHWKSLTSHLGLEAIITNDIDKIPKSEAAKRLDFFSQWKTIIGSGATYRLLITALLKINCGQDAEKVCEMLKESISEGIVVSIDSNIKLSALFLIGIDTPSIQPDSSSTSLDSDTRDDLKEKLDTELDNIIQLYSDYVCYIREAVKRKGVCANDLSSDLLTESAFNHTKQERILLSAHKAELENAADVNKIFNILGYEYASFFNYGIFQIIAKKYGIDRGQEELKYFEHLEDYLQGHNVSQFVEINPLLRKYTADSTKLVLKLDMKLTAQLTKLKKLKTAIAKILGIKNATLKLLDIKRGCVVVTFLIPTPVAELIFNENTVLTEEQEVQFPALSVLWLECNNCKFDFTDM